MTFKVSCLAEIIDSCLGIGLQDGVCLSSSRRLRDGWSGTRTELLVTGSWVNMDQTYLLDEVPLMTARMLSPSLIASLSLLT